LAPPARGSPLIAIDTSSWVAYLGGVPGPDLGLVDQALADRQACLPPVVLAEPLSAPALPQRLQALFLDLPLLPIVDGYWERAGHLRARVMGRRRKARLADTLIAQSCLDHQVPLVSRDTDFRAFLHGGLQLV
jgi:hypothetical protein